MNIIIHGTKGGWRVFYSTPNSPAIVSDSRSIASSENPVGKSAYSISFASNGCVFTKYVIVRDKMRSLSTGNVAFSIYLPNNQKLLGSETKSLLDQLSNHYCTKYTPDYNLDNVPENWTFVENITETFTLINASVNDVENIQQGTTNAAFIYFSTDEELQKYFDDPYQEEYYQFKQVLFVKTDLRDKDENPLNALQHSENDLTGRIDLEDTQYKLFFNTIAKGGVKIAVKVNGNTRSNKNKIRRKNDLEITWSKPYHKTEVQRGKCYEISSEYIVRDNNEQTISINEIELLEEEKTIFLEIKGRNGNPVEDAEIQLGSQPWQKISQPPTMTFKGEDIGKRWTVLVKKGDYLFSDTVTVSPENQVGSLIVNLKERKKVKITATNGEDIVNDFVVRIIENGINIKVSEIEFIDDEIYKTWTIEISKKEGREYYSGRIEYCPAAGENPLSIKLKKSMYSQPKQKKYSIDASERGTKSDNCPGYSYSSSGNDLDRDCIKPDKGYSFKGWKLNNDNDTLIAQYDKKKSSFRKYKVLLSLIVIVSTIVIIWVKSSSTSSENAEQPINKYKIQEYVQGDSLLLERLTSYKTNWEKQKPVFSEKGGGILDFFKGRKKNTNPNEYNEWDEVMHSLDSAITKRTFIDKADIEEVKKQNYFPKQKEFKTAFDKIDSDKYEIVGTQLGVVSALTLHQIANKIDSIVNKNNSQTNNQSGNATNIQEESAYTGRTPAIGNSTRSNSSGNGVNSDSSSRSSGSTSTTNTGRSSPIKKTDNQQNRQQVSSDKATKIKNYLKGDKLNEDSLKQYKSLNGLSKDLIKSLNLCLDFWELDGDKGAKRTYYSLNEKVKANEYFIGSKLKTFLEKMCEEGANPNPSYSKQDKISGLK